MINNIKNRKGGFLHLVLVIFVALLLLNYFHISVSDIVNWFKSLSVSKVVDWFKTLSNNFVK